MKLRPFACLLAALFVAASPALLCAQEVRPAPAAAKPNTAIVPTAKDPAWVRRHEGFVQQAQAGNIDLLFIGDSITDGWARTGKATWDKFYAPRKAANFGISADRTQNVLWRLENGEAKGISPKVVVLLIGTNNTGLERGSNTPRNTTEEASAGVHAVIAKIRELLPNSQLLVLSIFPRGEPSDPMREQIKQINVTLKPLAEKDQHITVLDIGDKFLAADGTIPADMMADKLHPAARGYEVWAEAMEATLVELLKK